MSIWFDYICFSFSSRFTLLDKARSFHRLYDVHIRIYRSVDRIRRPPSDRYTDKANI